MHVRTSDIRRGFTLIELLVVISMILVLATLAVLILPRLGDDQKSVRSADQLSMWLLISKQRAYRDQAPRGIRLVRSDPNLANPGYFEAHELVYIERPEDYLGTNLRVPAPGYPSPPNNTALIGGVDLTNNNTNYIVAPGDFLYFDTLESLPYNSHRISDVQYVAALGGTVLTFGTAEVPPTPSVINGGFPIPVPNNNTFRIIRQERPLAGEPVLQLPKDMIVDLHLEPTTYPNQSVYGYSWMPGLYTPSPNLDIVFNQRGQLMGTNSLYGKVILRVRNGSKPETVGDQFLVTVYSRTGLIAIHPMDITPHPMLPAPALNDPFRFVRDGNSSGL
jgi:prepilin-type N-terminal cleavage/methylation domain-containing protein